MTIRLTSGVKVEPLDTDVVISLPDGLTGTFTAFANEIFAWCLEHGVDADFITKWYEDGTFSIWRIDDSKQRMLFIMRWA